MKSTATIMLFFTCKNNTLDCFKPADDTVTWLISGDLYTRCIHLFFIDKVRKVGVEVMFTVPKLYL